jgi:hypothetical protein
VAEINIDDLDFVRHSNDTYTLNGRTIRLLGGDFENCPSLTHPPTYNEAVRLKLYGPPPEYLSRDRLNREDEARTNVEMPPGYEELGSHGNRGHGNEVHSDATTPETPNGNAIYSYMIANANFGRDAGVGSSDACGSNANDANDIRLVNDNVSDVDNACNDSEVNNANVNNAVVNNATVNNADVSETGDDANVSTLNLILNNCNGNETINSVIDYLPAIDSDVNSNDEFVNNNHLVA